jgi:hypothetical protein
MNYVLVRGVSRQHLALNVTHVITSTSLQHLDRERKVPLNEEGRTPPSC